MRSARVVAAALLSLLLVGAGARADAPAARQGAAMPRVGGPFALTATDGKPVTDHSFPGKWLVIYFGYTFCPDACPTALSAVGEALAQLGPAAAAFQPIFITVDPERDTPKILGGYVKNFDPRMIGLSGTPAQIAAVAKEYHVYYAVQPLGNGEYAIDHSSYIYVVNPKGQVAELLTGNVPGHQIADELRHLVQ